MNSVVDTIRSKYDSLTKKQKDIADYMLGSPEDMCYTTLKKISAAVGVSEMTILNLCTALGYSNFNEVKNEFRNYSATKRKDMAGHEDMFTLKYDLGRAVDGRAGLFGQICREELDIIDKFFAQLSIDEYYKAARMICAAKRVIICGRGISVCMANYMLKRFSMIGIPCMVVDTEAIDLLNASLYFIDRDSLVIPVSFPDYYSRTIKLAQFAKGKGATLLGITDNTRAEVAGICDMCIYCPTGTRLFFNSLTAPMIAANFLAIAVSVEKNHIIGDAESLSIEFSRLLEENR